MAMAVMVVTAMVDMDTGVMDTADTDTEKPVMDMAKRLKNPKHNTNL